MMMMMVLLRHAAVFAAFMACALTSVFKTLRRIEKYYCINGVLFKKIKQGSTCSRLASTILYINKIPDYFDIKSLDIELCMKYQVI